MKYTWQAQTIVNGWHGRPIKTTRQIDPNDENSEMVEADSTVRDVFQVIVGNAEYRTMDDSKEGRRLAEAIEDSRKSNLIVLDQGTFNWLKKQVEKVVPQLFRINGEVIDLLIREGYKKDNNEG